MTAPSLSRRRFLATAAGGATVAVAGPVLWRRTGAVAAPPTGVHLAYGADPTRQMTVSWSTPGPVESAVLEIGTDRRYGLVVPADSRPVRGTPTVYHHSTVGRLKPDRVYQYRVRHRGGVAAEGTFRTAPATVGPFRFTIVGDQGTSANAAAVTARIGALAPSFHVHVGDLCYANSTGDGQAGVTDQTVWDRWFSGIERQSARVPWMPAVGNHEMEPGYGEHGYDGFHARFALPGNGVPGAPHTWSLRYGNVVVIGLDANDASYEFAHNRGWLGRAQDDWLRSTLTAARLDPRVDFVVVGFHHCVYCSNAVHGSDGGVRDRWAAIFDEFAVDLVVNGHNHSYERTHGVRGGRVVAAAPAGATIEPASQGTVYVTAGGGGQQSYPVGLFPTSYVVDESGTRIPELADWSAVRDFDYSVLVLDSDPALRMLRLYAVRADGTVFDRLSLRRSARAAAVPA